LYAIQALVETNIFCGKRDKYCKSSLLNSAKDKTLNERHVTHDSLLQLSCSICCCPIRPLLLFGPEDFAW